MQRLWYDLFWIVPKCQHWIGPIICEGLDIFVRREMIMASKDAGIAPGLVTITDLALQAGVSKSTVSLVLQNSPLIRPETAARVREAAEQLGYVYNRQAANLRGKSSNIIGIVINDLANPFFAELLVGMERRLVDAGYICLMAHTDERLDIQEKVLVSMREHHAAGLIWCPVLDTPESVQKTVATWGIPLLVVIRSLGKGNYDFAGADNEAGTRLATEHLIAQGHKRIAFLGRVGAWPVYVERRAGYQRAMKNCKLSMDPGWIIDIPPTRRGGYDGIGQILALPDPPTAAVCYNDIVAFGAISALGERGLMAGRDFALIGFDGVAATEHSNPPLSTIDIEPGRLGEAAADVLLRRIHKPGSRPLRHLAVPKLIVRQSSSLEAGAALKQRKVRTRILSRR
jgi:LacI family transcriptional regulator